MDITKWQSYTNIHSMISCIFGFLLHFKFRMSLTSSLVLYFYILFLFFTLAFHTLCGSFLQGFSCCQSLSSLLILLLDNPVSIPAFPSFLCYIFLPHIWKYSMNVGFTMSYPNLLFQYHFKLYSWILEHYIKLCVSSK
jgi:hypothetical protein